MKYDIFIYNVDRGGTPLLILDAEVEVHGLNSKFYSERSHIFLTAESMRGYV